MSIITIKQLLEAGVHFGHQTRRWNPKMQEYIFTERNGIYIIDLQKTVNKLNEAYDAMRRFAEDGRPVPRSRQPRPSRKRLSAAASTTSTFVGPAVC